MNRAIAMCAVTLTALVAASPVLATGDDVEEAIAQRARVEMVLISQTFDLAPNGDIDLVYRITGDIEDAADLAPPTTTTTTTTTAPPMPDTNAETSVPTDTPTNTPTDTSPVAADDTPPPPEPEPLEIDVRVRNYPRLDANDDLDAIIGPDPLRSRLPPVIDGVELTDVRSQIEIESPTSAILTISVPTDSGVSVSERLAFDDDGIHPLVTELLVDGNVIAEHGTVVERRTESGDVPPTIDLALFASAPDPGPSAPLNERRDAVETFAALVELAAATGPSITFDVAPQVVLDLAASGRLGDDVTDMLVDDEFLSAPATPFDISSAAAVDRVDAFRRQLVAGEDDMGDALGELPVRTVWHPTTALSGEGAQVLRDLGVRYLAVTSDLFETTVDDVGRLPDRDRFVPVDLPDGTSMPILLIDDELGAEFTTEATDATLSERTPTEWSVATVARLRLDQMDSPRDELSDARSHLIAAPGLGTFDPRLVNQLERFARTTRAIQFSSGGSLTSNTDTLRLDERLTLPETAGPSLAARLDRITDVQVFMVSAASMLPDGDPRLAAWERRLDSFVSTAFADDTVNAELDDLLAEADELFSAVVAPEPFTFTLTGDASIRVSIGNTSSEPLNVVLGLDSPRLSFPDGNVAVTLEPNADTLVVVPVEIRSNGTSSVTVDVTTPLGDPLVEPVTLTSRVNALTGLGQVLTGAMVLMLLAWWFSHWRSRRRAEQADSSHDASAAAS
jgi:hypothetical protein